ncbi:MAG: pyridoxal phosphate-dependent aminotransferase [Bacteroidia bacterium]|nr:pyridoxal phosphate-dependent aminotransferase [Bacteroidia bacterium]MCX7652757.1 pyridoxal phosphate-dependent aminotransferase [Bacteroidia bacterium]MDW8417410.1 pyridoxal phosphate-dependent aminotransferase [Bacteroidia bacterium]
MYKLSERAEKVPPSPIRKLVPYATAAKSRGKKVLHLNIGQPDLPTPSEFWTAIQKAQIKVLDYTESAGMPAFREAYARFYNEIYNIPLEAQHFLTTTGGSEALLFAFLTLFSPNDEVIVIEPTYANYIGLGWATGVTLRPIQSYIEDDFALPAPETLEAAINEYTRGILLCNPSNPTGKLYSEAEVRKIADICRRHDLYLLSDESYRDYCYDGEKFFSALEVEGAEDFVVVVDTLSKRYSACGARIGALVSRNTDIINAALKWAQARLAPPTLGQIGGLALLSLPKAHYDYVRDTFQKRRDTLTEGLRSIPGVTVATVQGAFYLMPKLPVADSDAFAQWLLERFDIDGTTVMIAPGTGFFSNPDKGRNLVRIAYVLENSYLEQAVEILRTALNIYAREQVPIL